MRFIPESRPKIVHILEVKSRARQLGIQPLATMTRKDLIQAIQNKEGNRPCFQTNLPKCQYADCLWYGECQKG